MILDALTFISKNCNARQCNFLEVAARCSGCLHGSVVRRQIMERMVLGQLVLSWEPGVS